MAKFSIKTNLSSQHQDEQTPMKQNQITVPASAENKNSSDPRIPTQLNDSEKKKWKSSYPACDNDSGNNRNEGDIGEPGLPPKGHDVGKDGGEERRGGPNSLVERDRQIPERNVSEHDGDTEDEAESRDLKELDRRSNGLHRDYLQPRYGDVAEQGTSGHVAHGEEDRVLEAIVAKQDPNVGGVPRGNQPDREQTAGTLHLDRWVLIGRLRFQQKHRWVSFRGSGSGFSGSSSGGSVPERHGSHALGFD
ncbi:hypothetical protein TorRG33x02_165680 [Trema orientale]|uniref:Uncharacterized protein n=1 Tax=Trema orientale TaxID=63057 RepID=A0A2P5EQ19_TREOI|nr:hypothetical protein TorRG33x02_165680 [Trema orientale]